MPKEWSEAEIEKLRRLRQLGASPSRAALALRMNKTKIRRKALELGIPFPAQRTERRERQAKEVAARAQAGLPPKSL